MNSPAPPPTAVKDAGASPDFLCSMNMFRRGPTPPNPPRISQEETRTPRRPDRDAPEAETSVAPKQKSGLMRAVNMINPMNLKATPFPGSKAASSEPGEEDSSQVSRTSSSESLEQKKASSSAQNPGVLRGALQKVNPFKSSAQVQKDASGEDSADPRGSEEDLSNKRNPGGITNVIQKVNPFRSSHLKDAGCGQRPPGGEAEETDAPVKEAANPGVLRGALQKVNPFKSSAQVQKDASGEDSADPRGSEEDLSNKRNPGGITNVIQKVNPFRSSHLKDAGCGQRPPGGEAEETDAPVKEAANPGSLKGMIQKVNPFRSRTQAAETETGSAVPLDSPQEDLDVQTEKMESSERVDDSSIERYSVWYIDADPAPPFRPRPQEKGPSVKAESHSAQTKNSTNIEDSQTLQQEPVEVQTLQLAEDEEGLWAWWRTVEGWDEWNEANPYEDEEVVVEAADRVFMAARLFVRLFNMHGASLQQRILELLAMADSADNFHKRTVTASIGGGVASVAGSVTTITGLILAPFTAGTSLITDRKKVEKMIKDYEEEIKDIKECLEFLQEGMETLEEWNFEKYAESISEKHLNQNIKHVMKEGGRAGKALAITQSL
ncbi:hypothetical protein OJAV_G00236970 [Oryzias javanicus]|uniref:Uncharacterized protein n=1 Tax=Oryzias javanicus TaxID=123683 RepID=A0A3S2NSQ2_ORYJA|nr:hypothetical protein OJAV_G00236970 [Oryzias javanicus]